jgi:16S rRNA (cytosine967-C5)-methyltransferase
LVDLLLEQYGKETFLEIIDGISAIDNSIYLFHNLKKGSEDDFISALAQDSIFVTATEVPHLFKSESGFSVENSSAFQNGWFHIIGKNSAKAASFILNNAKTTLDLCAAPGGKTFVMAALNEGTIHAFDIHPHKVKIIEEGATRLDLRNVKCRCADASIQNEQLVNSADFVLCDVPCSGLGIMGKKPDIKYKKYESTAFTDLQYKILENGALYLRSNGRLVYSTCTLDRRENELQIQKFLDEHPNFSLDIGALQSGFQTFLPKNGEDGFFIAVLRKA